MSAPDVRTPRGAPGRTLLALALLATPALTACDSSATADAAEGTPDELTAMQTASVSDYAVVTGWPRYPDGVQIGQASGLAVTPANEVVLFQRGLPGDRNDEGLLDAPTIMVFDPATGELLRSMGEGMFANPHGLDIDDEGNLWIADTRLHQVIKLSPEGEVLMTIGEPGVTGETADLLNGVTDVAVTSDGSFWVSDGYGNNRVLKYDAEGNLLFQIGGERGSEPGLFDLPHGITVDDQGRAYVADRTNSRVQVFSPEGEFITEWNHWDGQAQGDPGRPWGLEFHDGSIYVADGGEYWLTSQYVSNQPDTLPFDMAQIQRFDTEGNLQEAWGYFGPQDGRMIWPHDVTVDADGGVYSAEVHTGQRLQKWAPGGGNIR